MSQATTMCVCPRCRSQRLARARAGAVQLEKTVHLAHVLAELRGGELEVADLRRAGDLMSREGQA